MSMVQADKSVRINLDELENTAMFVDENRRMNINLIANYMAQNYCYVSDERTQDLYYWNKSTGTYFPADNQVPVVVQGLIPLRFSEKVAREVMYNLKIRSLRNIVEELPSTDLIPLSNGIYNYKNKSFFSFGPEHLFFRKHPIVYGGENKGSCGEINAFLSQVVDEKDVPLLKALVGYCFVRHYNFHNFFLLIGEGSNGKSVFLNLLAAMLGQENVCSQSLQDLSDNQWSVGELRNRNANLIGDMSQSKIRDVSLLKQLTGNDLISASRKYKSPVFFRNHAKIIASMNQIPIVDDSNNGFHRRHIIISFPNSFVGKEDRALIDRLTTESEMSAFFLECMREFEKIEASNGFDIGSLEGNARKYLTYSDSPKMFAEECLEEDEDGVITKKALYGHYCKFCGVYGVKPQSSNTFFRSIKRAMDYRISLKSKKYMGELDDQGNEKREPVVVGVCLKEELQWI